jgi:hypothetical protein
MRPLFLVAAGAILGFVSAKALFVGIAVTFVVWGLAALGIGVLSTKPRAAATNGASFGFPLTSVFAVFAYTGSDPAGAVPSYILAGIVGAISCLALSLVGAVGRRVFGR